MDWLASSGDRKPLRVGLGPISHRQKNPVSLRPRLGQVARNSGRTIDTLMGRTILPPLLEHETPASSWGLDQLALRNCSWFPLRLASCLRQTTMPLRWLRANDLLAVQEEKTRCRCSPNCRELVKSESWVQPFGELVLPAILRRLPGDRPRANSASVRTSTAPNPRSVL